MDKDDNVMTIKRFMDLWNDKNQARTVVILQKDDKQLTVIISFPPDVVVIGKMDLCIDPLLCDPM